MRISTVLYQWFRCFLSMKQVFIFLVFTIVLNLVTSFLPSNDAEMSIAQAVSIIGAERLRECTLISASSFWNEFPLNPVFENPQILIQPIPENAGGGKRRQFQITRPFEFRYAKACGFGIWHDVDEVGNPGNIWKELDSDLMENFPGGTFHSFHIIYTSRPAFLYFQRPVPFVVTQMHHLLVFGQSTLQAAFECVTPSVWYNESILISRSNWYSNSSLTTTDVAGPSVFYSKWQNYGRHGPLVLATTPDNQPKDLDLYARTKVVRNYIVATAFEIVRYLNTTTTLLPDRTGVYGAKDKLTGKWIGMVGEIVHGKAHFTSLIGLEPERAEVIRYSLITAFTGATFVSGFPKERELSGSLSFLASPFTTFVWGAIFTILVLLAAVMTLGYFVEVKEGEEKELSHILSILSTDLLRPVLDQPNVVPVNYLGALHRSLEIRILFLFWMIGLIVLSTSYKSKVISALLSPYTVHPPKTFEELAESNFKIGAILFNESTIGDSFRSMKSKMSKEILRRVKGYRYMQPDCVALIKTEDHVCMGITQYLGFTANVFLTDKNGQPHYKFSTESIFPILAGMSVPRNFPHLLDPLDRVIWRLYSLGMTDKWISRQQEASALIGQRMSKSNDKFVQHPTKDRSGILHVLFILAMGLCFATAVFLVEIGLSYLVGRYAGIRKSVVEKLVQNYKIKHVPITFVHPYNDPVAWEGYSKLVKEIKDQLKGIKPSCFVLSVGGGGLLMGTLLGLDDVGWVDVPVVAMETIVADSFNKTLKAAKIVDVKLTSVAKCLGAPSVTPQLLEVLPKFNVISATLGNLEAVKACVQFAGKLVIVSSRTCLEWRMY